MNIIECAVDQAIFYEANMARVDIKDSKISGSKFIGCDLSGASISSNIYSNVIFESCRFFDTGVSGCHFVNCQFTKCDLNSVVIKDCRFTSCQFVGCATNTKTIEGSILLECQFQDMDLPIDIIAENYGLKKSDCFGVRLKGAQVKGKGQPDISEDEFLAMAHDTRYTALQKLSIHFYLDGNIDVFSEVFSSATDIRSWSDVATAPASICVAIDKLSDFLIYLYKSSAIPIFGILRLHSITSDIFALPPERVGEFVFPIYAAHVKLSHVVEEYLSVLTKWQAFVAPIAQPRLEFGASGPVNQQFFQEFLASIGFPVGVIVEDVRPRNSPVLLQILAENKDIAIALLSIFLASRTEVEIGHSVAPEAKPGKNAERSNFSLVIGMAGENAREALAMNALLPGGWTGQFKLAFSTTFVKKARNVFVELISVK